MKKHKNKYELKWYRILENFAIAPIVLAMFPIPLAFPLGIIAMCIQQPEELPLAIIYFSYLTLAVIFLYYMETKYQ